MLRHPGELGTPEIWDGDYCVPKCPVTSPGALSTLDGWGRDTGVTCYKTMARAYTHYCLPLWKPENVYSNVETADVKTNFCDICLIETQPMSIRMKRGNWKSAVNKHPTRCDWKAILLNLNTACSKEHYRWKTRNIVLHCLFCSSPKVWSSLKLSTWIYLILRNMQR